MRTMLCEVHLQVCECLRHGQVWVRLIEQVNHFCDSKHHHENTYSQRDNTTTLSLVLVLTFVQKFGRLPKSVEFTYNVSKFTHFN